MTTTKDLATKWEEIYSSPFAYTLENDVKQLMMVNVLGCTLESAGRLEQAETFNGAYIDGYQQGLDEQDMLYDLQQDGYDIDEDELQEILAGLDGDDSEWVEIEDGKEGFTFPTTCPECDLDQSDKVTGDVLSKRECNNCRAEGFIRINKERYTYFLVNNNYGTKH